MGGDYGPQVIVPAALQALAAEPQLHLILVGDEAVLKPRLENHRFGSRLTVRHASQKVEMDESPSRALRLKKDSSMRVAINLVKSGEAHACVSAGNTGALMATARYVLKTLPGIDRPAISTVLPTMRGTHTHVLDLGANVDSTAQHLYEFGVMGSVLAHAVDSNPSPKVGLLNIGEEEMKGNEIVREAGKLLTESKLLNYIGYVEGDDIFKGTADVVVCDGFVGNIALKTTEGVAKMIAHYVKQEFRRNWLTRIAALVSLPVLRNLKNKIDPRRYNGASLLGLQGIVVKSHGGADVLAFTYAIKEAMLEVEKNVPHLINSRLSQLLSEPLLSAETAASPQPQRHTG
jgi:glycerol-3-phosphate acyltransferase PlsX